MLLEGFVERLSFEERHAWDEFTEADAQCQAATRTFVHSWLAKLREQDRNSPVNEEHLASELEKAWPLHLEAANARLEGATTKLELTLSKENADSLASIRAVEAATEPPRLELRHFQRYILKRVFDLGWTVERFGRFDRFSIGYKGRDASKAERIGKKYQWIAFHEILAFVSDRFQYREQYGGEDGDNAYEGPWQLYRRDIDPSCTLRSTPGGTSWSGHAPSWWGPMPFNKTHTVGQERAWVQQVSGLPMVEDLLCITNPDDGVRWLNVQGYFAWQQQAPADRASTEVDRGELWYLCNGYLIQQEDTAAFLAWAEGVDFWGRWMPDPPEVYRMFLGEYGWSPASRYFERPYYGDNGWIKPRQGCPVKMRTAAFEYLRESSGFDCAIDEGFTLRLPDRELATQLGLRWSGEGADFLDAAGILAAQDPTVREPGPSALLLRADLLQKMRRSTNLTLCWAVLGEKRILTAGWHGPNHPALRISGAYVLGESGLCGFEQYILDDPNAPTREPRILDIRRTH